MIKIPHRKGRVLYDFKCSSGGHHTRDLNNIFEFNKETEAWTEIGSMKERRRHHRLTIVSYDDYAKWCK